MPRSPNEQPLIGVLGLQGAVPEHIAMLQGAGADAMPVRRRGDLDEVDGIVLPGGESTTMSNLLLAFELLDPLRERIAAGMPAFGSCAGMILLAGQVLDGRKDQHQLDALDVVVRRNAFGRQVDSFETDLDVDGASMHAVFIRAPWVDKASDDVEVLARVPATGVPEGAADRIVAVRQGAVLATAFHPELTGDDRMHRLFTAMVTGAQESNQALEE